MQIPDSTICSLLNQGEEKGMEYLFTRYYKPLVLWAASFLNNIPQSEDLVQDFFIRLWYNIFQKSEFLQVLAHTIPPLRSKDTILAFGCRRIHYNTLK